MERIFSQQYYIEILFKAMFMLSYYGLLRVGEIASEVGQFKADHALKAGNIHVGQNKPKIMIVLHSSKTHGKESPPQKIKISARTTLSQGRERYLCQTHFCPFAVMREYMKLRGQYDEDNEQLFIFRHNVPVRPPQIRRILRTCLENLGLDASCYDMHSMRSGRASDLLKAGFSISEVKIFGRWRSNAVYRYLKQ